jgi:hypothetical protein
MSKTAALKRLVDLHTYADALALRAEMLGGGNQRDLRDIVRALEELIALKAMPAAKNEYTRAA